MFLTMKYLLPLEIEIYWKKYDSIIMNIFQIIKSLKGFECI